MQEKSAEHDIKYVGFWKRFLAALINLALSSPFIYITNKVNIFSIAHKSIFPAILVGLLTYLFIAIVTVKYGGTPGKLIMKIRIVDAKGNYLSYTHAILRQTIDFLYSIIFWLQLHLVIRSTLISELPQNAREVSFLTTKYGGSYQTSIYVLVLVTSLDCLFVVTNHKKRAIHDLLAKSYVIDKSTVMGKQVNLWGQ